MTAIVADPQQMSAMMFGGPSRVVGDYIQQKLQSFQSAAAGLTGSAADHLQQFVSRATGFFQEYNSEDVHRRVRQIVTQHGTVFNDDIVRLLQTAAEIQAAKPRMQRFLMANEVIFAEAQAGNIHGWRDTYVDTQPGTTGWLRYDYQVLNEGFVKEDEDGLSYSEHFAIDYQEGDHPLELSEQVAIMSSTEIALFLMEEEQIDISNPEGGRIG